MAYKGYLGPQNLPDPATTPTGEQSTSMPAGTLFTQSWILLRLRSFPGTNDSLGNVTSLPQTARQDTHIKPWLTPPLAKQTIDAQTWTFAFEAFESDAAMNAKIVPILYGWDPTTATKRGTIYDNSTALGNEFAVTTQTGRVITWAGAELGVEENDRLVFEVWQTMTQSMATSYQSEFAFNGSTDPTEGSTTGNAASYLSCPQDLLFSPFPPVHVPRHSRNSLIRR